MTNKTAKTKLWQIRMSKDYKERIIKEANKQDISLSDYAKNAINKVLPKKG